MEAALSRRKQSVDEVLNEGQRQLENELTKIEQFYAQFYDIIDEHKRRVTE
jgi:hypothetical protein